MRLMVVVAKFSMVVKPTPAWTSARCEDFIRVLQSQKVPPNIRLSAAKLMFQKVMKIMDPRSLDKYFGTQPGEKRWTMHSTARYGLTGAIVPKEHTFTVVSKERPGYFELFGLAQVTQKDGEWWFIINQAALEKLGLGRAQVRLDGLAADVKTL
jgi:hypothetical protein